MERAAATEVALRLVGLARSFGAVQAVNQVNLTLQPGEMLGLVGPDGAGKTTLARLAAGVLAPSTGRVEPDTRGRVGYLAGRYSLYPDLTVLENIRFFGRIFGMRPAQAVEEGQGLLEWVGLWPFRDRLSGLLSGGMRQKLALACALVHQPPVLILDEPTTAVDPVAREEFWCLLRLQAEAGRAVLVTTPYMDEAENCHRVGLLHQGALLAVDQPAALKAELPWQMYQLTPFAGMSGNRMRAIQTAEGLAGQRWTQPHGSGVRVALEPGSQPAPPSGYELRPVPPTLEDVYIWRSGAAEEVRAG